MKKFLLLLLSISLCIPRIAYAMPTHPEVLREEKDIAEETESSDKREENTGDVENTKNTGVSVSAPSAILIENSTGDVIFEKDADTQRPPASVTKVMTMLLIFDALESGKIKLEDSVTTSEYAASMGGSQVFLEPGETQTVDTMLKCIAVASANDACVTLKKRNLSRETKTAFLIETWIPYKKYDKINSSQLVTGLGGRGISHEEENGSVVLCDGDYCWFCFSNFFRCAS